MISLKKLKSTKQKLMGSRVYLRVLEVTDATEEYSRWLSDPEVNRFLATKSATVSQLKQYIMTKNQKNDCVLLGIFLKDSDDMIGTIKLEYVHYGKGTADIAIMLGDRNHAGKGFGGEAMKTLIEYAFADLGLSEITLGVVVQNAGAVHAYEKLGFKETGRKLGVVEYGGNRYDQMTMRLQKAL